MLSDRRQYIRYPCNSKIGIFLAKGEYGPAETATLTGNLIDLSIHGAGLSLPEILDGSIHLAYTAMESNDLLLHIIIYQNAEQKIILPTKPAWFNRSLSEHLTPFNLGVKFSKPLLTEQLKIFIS